MEKINKGVELEDELKSGGSNINYDQ